MKNLKKPLIYCLLSAISLYACVPLEESKAVSAAEVSDTSFYTFPAEFEEHEAVWIKWTTETYLGNSTDGVIKAVIKALNPFVKIKLVVSDKEEESEVKRILQEEGIPYSHVEFFINPNCTDRWLRDNGPVFVRNNEGQYKIVDFGFNSWGVGKQEDPINIDIDVTDRSFARILNIPAIRSSMISEGGDRDFNGKGTVMVTESVELQRNPDMTKEQIAEELKRVLGQKKVLWLRTGPIEGDQMKMKGALPGNAFTSTTCGHIDEYARFADPNTIILAQVSEEERQSNEIMSMTYDILEENYQMLKKETDQDGNPFNIIRIPVTDHYYVSLAYSKEIPWYELSWYDDLRYFDGTPVLEGDTINQLIASSYLNFLVTNGCVLVAAYYKEGRPLSTRQKDEQAKEILQQAFPGREIIQIYEAEDLNSNGGGIHCMTQQQPKMLTGN
jgi:agmatine deiminase